MAVRKRKPFELGRYLGPVSRDRIRKLEAIKQQLLELDNRLKMEMFGLKELSGGDFDINVSSEESLDIPPIRFIPEKTEKLFPTQKQEMNPSDPQPCSSVATKATDNPNPVKTSTQSTVLVISSPTNYTETSPPFPRAPELSNSLDSDSFLSYAADLLALSPPRPFSSSVSSHRHPTSPPSSPSKKLPDPSPDNSAVVDLDGK